MGYGWRTSYFIIGVGVLLLLVAIAQLLRRDPSQILPLPNGENNTLSSEPGLSNAEGLTLKEAVHTRQFWTICTVNLSILFCFMTIMVHIVPHAQDINISATRAATILSTIGGVSMAGRFITGIVIDRIGSKKAMILCFILLIAGLLWLQIAKVLWMLYVFTVIYGFAHGGYFTTMSPIVAEFFGLNAHGVLFGIVAFCGTVGGAIGPILAGYIFDITTEYSLAFWLCTLISASGLLLLLLLKPIDKKRQRKNKN